MRLGSDEQDSKAWKGLCAAAESQPEVLVRHLDILKNTIASLRGLRASCSGWVLSISFAAFYGETPQNSAASLIEVYL